MSSALNQQIAKVECDFYIDVKVEDHPIKVDIKQEMEHALNRSGLENSHWG